MQAEKLVTPTNHKAVGAPMGNRRQSGGLGDSESGVHKWKLVLNAALKNKNPPAIDVDAVDDEPGGRIELTIADYEGEVERTEHDA